MGIIHVYFQTQLWCNIVATLTLGSQPMQGLTRVQDKKEAQEAHLILLGVQESVREWTLTLPSELPLWELESLWSSEPSRSDCKGQNSLNWKVIYIIGKLLKRTCLKWARMTGSQIDSLISNHQKPRIDPISLLLGDVQHIVGKLLTRAITLI
jgi:hypothetical protein